MKHCHTNFPHVDVMILNYNGEHHLDKCINSLGKTRYPDFSIILIDNNSSDNSIDLVTKKYPHVKIIKHQENLGFGKGYDRVICESKTEFIALLNNDTRVDPDWLTPLVAAMIADENIAAAGSKLLFMEYPEVVNHAGGGMNFIGLGYDREMFEPDNKVNSEATDVLFPSGAACLIRKNAYQKVGGFDSKYFMYHEDVDLGWRFWLFGYRIRSIPESKVYHSFGGSSLQCCGMTFRNNLGYRHAIRSLIKNYQVKKLAKSLPLLLVLGLRSFFRDRSINFIHCFLWNLYHLPSTFKQRCLIQKSRVKTDQEINHLIWPHLQLPVYYSDYPIMSLKTFSESGNKPNFISMHDNPPIGLGYGWHAADRLDLSRIIYRWSKKRAVLFLWNPHGSIRVVLQVLAMAESVGHSRKFFFFIQDIPVKSALIGSDRIQFIELNYTGEKTMLELKICCEKTWSPDKLYRNQDHRNLGLGVISVATAASSSDKRPYNGLSVIIPTYNRYKSLEQVLAALEKQTIANDSFEIIVVDDGSTDDTRKTVCRFLNVSPLNIKYIRQENKKQGAARNNGLKNANMPLIVFMGDDIIPAPDFLEAHMSRHNNENIDDKLVIIGHTHWSGQLKITPFMEYIHEYGHQFGFSIMDDINDLPFNFFYTSNISLSKEFLFEQEMIFDESFETYGWEDIELGYRLKNNGMRLCLEDKAVAFHNHPIDIKSFCRRQFNVGKSSRSFLKKHPELKSFLGKEDLKKKAGYHLPAMILANIVNAIDRRNIKLSHRIYNFILFAFYCLGAQSEERKKS